MWMRRGRVAALLLFLWGVATTVTLAPALAEAGSPDEDLRAVYCLAAAHRGQLLEAAEHLGIGTPSPTEPGSLVIGTKTYRAEQLPQHAPRQFERACSALIATVPQLGQSEGTGLALTLVNLVAPVLLGSALTLLVQRADANRALRVETHENLRRAANRYTRAAREYVDAWVADPGASDADVSESAFDLETELTKFRAGRARREAAAELAATVGRPPDPGRGHPRENPNHAERAGLAQQELRRIAKIIGDTEAVIRTKRWGLPRRRTAKPQRTAGSPAVPGGEGGSAGRPGPPEVRA